MAYVFHSTGHTVY